MPAFPTPPWWTTDYRFGSFGQFAQVMRACYEPVLTDPLRYHLAARQIFHGLVLQNVRYVELSYSLGHAVDRRLPQDEIIDAIGQAAPPGLVLRLICGLSRSRPVPPQERALASVLGRHGLDGLDLHGDENAQGPEPFAGLFADARRLGLLVKAHAGELAGPSSIRAAVDILGVRRIEHGVTAIEDDGLVADLAAQAITLDMCITSNVKLGVVPHAAAHPLARLHRRGVRVTVSTDNPMVLGCSLTGELTLLPGTLGFSLHDLAQVQRNAFQVARIPEASRSPILAELDALQRSVLEAQGAGSLPPGTSD
jgi:adenosine deaminase